jgi:hypothetical protein
MRSPLVQPVSAGCSRFADEALNLGASKHRPNADQVFQTVCLPMARLLLVSPNGNFGNPAAMGS